MHGIKSHPQYALQGNLKERLESIKTDNRKLDGFISKLKDQEKVQEETTKRFNDITEKIDGITARINAMEDEIDDNYKQYKFEQLQTSIDEMNKFLYGCKEETDDELKKNGFIENVNKTFAQLREEYVELIEQYIGNSTPRQDRERFIELEQRVQKLEEKPKLVVQRETKIPSFDRAKKISN